MSRFVILEHDHPTLHWDLLLDNGEQRVPTWRLRQAPSEQPQLEAGMRFAAKAANMEKIDAVKLPDHRRMYLDYEGPVSGDRGQVTRWDAGQYIEIGRQEDVRELRLEGVRLRGFAMLVRTATPAPDNWLFHWVVDELEIETDEDVAR